MAIDDARAACRVRNRRFFTPDLLLALIRMRTGRVAACFRQVEQSRNRVTSGLERYVAKLTTATAGEYVEFARVERADVQHRGSSRPAAGLSSGAAAEPDAGSWRSA